MKKCAFILCLVFAGCKPGTIYVGSDCYVEHGEDSKVSVKCVGANGVGNWVVDIDRVSLSADVFYIDEDLADNGYSWSNSPNQCIVN